MAWTKLDDHFPDHPKVIAAGPLASWLFVCGLAYCGRLLTDGFIPSGQIRKLADVEDAHGLARTLVEVGLWERAEGGYRVHDYLDYQPSKEHVLQTREVRAEAGRKGGKQKASNLLEARQDFATAFAKQNSTPSRTRPVPEPVDDPSGADAPERAGKPRDVRAKATVIAEDWQPTPELRAYAVEWGIPERDVDEVAREFVAYWRQSKGRKIDWGMTFQNRVRDVAPQYARRARASPGANGLRSPGAGFARIVQEGLP